MPLSWEGAHAEGDGGGVCPAVTPPFLCYCGPYRLWLKEKKRKKKKEATFLFNRWRHSTESKRDNY